MKRVCLALAAVFAITGSGCSLKGARIPQADIPFAKADYKILGDTNAQECGTYILGIDWGHLFKNEGAAMSGGASGGPIPPFLLDLLPSGLTPEASRALFVALDKMPEATHLIAPRVQSSAEGVILGPVVLFGKRCSTVTARGVRIGNGPTVNQ